MTSQKQLIAVSIAVLLLALHALAVLVPWPGRMAGSYVLQILGPLFAGAVAVWISLERKHINPAQWMLVALSFAFWATGMATNMCIDVSALTCTKANAGSVAMTAYILYGVPILLVLATPSSQWSTPLVRLLDAAMVLMLTALILYYTLAASKFTDASEDALRGDYVDLFDLQNFLLMTFAAVRFFSSTDPTSRSLYASVAAFAACYLIAATTYNRYVVMHLDGAVGTLYDVIVQVPFAVFCCVAALHRADDGQRRSPAALGLSDRMQRFAEAIPPFFLTLTVVALSTLIAKQSPHVAIACTSVAILVYGLRSTMQQVQHMGAVSRAEHDRDVMADLAWNDALTGIGNRRAFDAALHLEWERARRSGHPLGLLMIDIDHFKSVNDVQGHTSGDELIRAVGSALSAAGGWSNDVLARYGGDEFVCLLPDTQLQNAKAVAERMRRSVERLELPHPSNAQGHITISVGVASINVRPHATSSLLVNMADRALYFAKERGRNRSETSSS